MLAKLDLVASSTSFDCLELKAAPIVISSGIVSMREQIPVSPSAMI